MDKRQARYIAAIRLLERAARELHALTAEASAGLERAWISGANEHAQKTLNFARNAKSAALVQDLTEGNKT